MQACLELRHSAARQQLPGILVAILTGLLLVRLAPQDGLLLVAGMAVFLLTVVQPLIGLGLALIAGPFGALESQLLGISVLDSGQILLLFSLLAWVARGLRRRHLWLPHTPLNLPFAFFIFVGLLSLLNAPSAVFGLREVLKWVEMAAIMLMVVAITTDPAEEMTHAHRRRLAIWLVAALLLAGVVQALIGIWQFGLRADGPEHFLVLDRFYRAYGTFEQPNPFGGFMNLTLLPALGLLLGLLSAGFEGQEGYRFSNPRLLRWLIPVAAAAVLGGLALVFSWSRGAWLGFAAGGAVLLFLWPRRQRYGWVLLLLVVVFIAVAVVADVVPAAVSGRLAGFAEDLTFGDVRGVDINDANYSVLERLAHWQAALDMARDHVWLGVGFGNYEPTYAEYALINWPDPLGHAHNYYLNLLAEVGVIGLSVYALFWAAVLWQTWRLLQQLAWPERGLALGLMAAWMALSVHHLVDKLYVNNIYLHLGVLLGLLQLLGCADDSSAGVRSRSVAGKR